MGQGREAATVRQFILVVVLVAASFLGGAFVNGPGLSWVQTQLLGSLGLNEGGEIATVDLKGTATTGASGEGSGLAKAGAEALRGPLAPVPSLVTEGETSHQDASDRPAARPAQPGG